MTVDILVTYKTGKGTATTKPTSRDRYVFMMPSSPACHQDSAPCMGRTR